jgi:acyl-coenzyme A thioesterase PaaI-like protein
MPDHSFVMFRSDGDTLVPMPMAAGPWIAGALSGAALAPLMASLVEDTPTPCPMLTTRLGIEFLRPVPMAPLRAERIVLREGRKQQLLRVILRAAGREVAAATAVRLRVDPAEPLDPRSPVPVFTPPEGPPFRPAISKDSAMLPAIDSRMLSTAGAGTGAAWLRYQGTIIDQRPLTPFVRAALFSDFGNGLAPILDPAEYSFLNADITLHLARLPVGEWLHLSCRTLDGGHGLGMVHTALGDALGPIGWAHQSLLFQRRADL